MGKLPALKKLTEAVKKRAKERGYLIGLDGRHIPVRSTHSALNTLLQGGGAVAMKMSMELFDDAIAEAGLRVDYLLTVHDEFQLETHPETAEQVGQLAADAIRLAGERLNLKCPLAGAYKIGPTWQATH